MMNVLLSTHEIVGPSSPVHYSLRCLEKNRYKIFQPLSPLVLVDSFSEDSLASSWDAKWPKCSTH